jgi:hypothetical protein
MGIGAVSFKELTLGMFIYRIAQQSHKPVLVQVTLPKSQWQYPEAR